jgi:hypothetical protein
MGYDAFFFKIPTLEDVKTCQPIFGTTFDVKQVLGVSRQGFLVQRFQRGFKGVFKAGVSKRFQRGFQGRGFKGVFKAGVSKGQHAPL